MPVNRLAAVWSIMLSLCAPTAALADNEWRTHYSRAEQAYARHDLFGARKEFLTALKIAEDCREAPLLAGKLETLASTYQLKEQTAEAAPLIKLAKKLRAKFDIAAGTGTMPR